MNSLTQLFGNGTQGYPTEYIVKRPVNLVYKCLVKRNKVDVNIILKWYAIPGPLGTNLRKDRKF